MTELQAKLHTLNKFNSQETWRQLSRIQFYLPKCSEVSKFFGGSRVNPCSIANFCAPAPTIKLCLDFFNTRAATLIGVAILYKTIQIMDVILRGNNLIQSFHKSNNTSYNNHNNNNHVITIIIIINSKFFIS